MLEVWLSCFPSVVANRFIGNILVKYLNGLFLPLSQPPVTDVRHTHFFCQFLFLLPFVIFSIFWISMLTIVTFLEIFWCFRGKTRLEYFRKELAHCLLEILLFTHILVHFNFLISRKVQMQLVLYFWLWRFAKLNCTLCIIAQIDLRLEKIILHCACLWFIKHRSQSLFIWYHLFWNR